MPSVDRLFVYGNLRRRYGHDMYHVLAEYADFLGEAHFQGILYDTGLLHGAGAVPSDNPNDRVKGELYAVRHPALVLPVLDAFVGCGETPEEEPGHFRRERVVVTLSGGAARVGAWAYLFVAPTEGFRRIPSGDFLARHRTGRGRAPRGR